VLARYAWALSDEQMQQLDQASQMRSSYPVSAIASSLRRK